MFTIDKLTERLVRESIRRGHHIDGRDLFEYRPISVEIGFSPVAEGSALVRLGEEKSTKVLAGVKTEIDTPYESSPDEGFINVTTDWTPFASPIKMRELDDEDIIVARVVDRALRSSEAVPVDKLVIDVGERVRGIYIGLTILDDFGNVMDAASLAALAALKNTKMPKVVRTEDGIVLDDSEWHPLPLRSEPVLVSFYRIDGQRIVDPTYEEEHVADLRLTFGIAEVDGEEYICAVHKSGPGLITYEEIEMLTDKAFELASYLRKQIR